MKTILLTGGIGSGKSSVAAYLSEKGIPVYDSDSRARALYEGEVLAKVEAALGMSLRGPDRAFDKQKLSKEIFSNPSSREKVEAVVHKAVLEDFLLWRASRQEPWVVFESAIALTRPLFDGVYQLVLLVTAPIPQRIDRVVKRSGLSPSEVLSRMKSQQYDLLRADAVINNDSDLQTLRSRTDIAVNLLVKLKYLLNLQDK